MLAGVILAGGQSSRMGTDKSLLTLPGSQQSLLEHCQKQLSAVCDNKVFVSGSQHKDGITDLIPNCGPLSGIHAAISYFSSQHTNITELLLVAVDMPGLCLEDFSYLLNMGRKGHSLCTFKNSFLPIYIPLSIDVIAYIRSVFNSQYDDDVTPPKQRQYSIKKMLESLQSRQIQPLKNTQLRNINTPAQWQQHCAEQSITKA